jgi:diguanylate cyclase (GGDEF)-like protein
VLVCVVVPLLLMGAYLLDQTESVLGERARDAVDNHLATTAGILERRIAERMREGKSWSRSFVVYENVEAMQRPGAAPNKRLEVDSFLQTVLGHNFQTYESLFVLDRQRRPLAWTRHEQLEDWALELLREPLPPQGLITGLRHSEPLNGATMLVIHEIHPGGAGRDDPSGPLSAPPAIGYLVGRLKLDAFLEPLANPRDNEPEFWLLNGEGQVVIRRGRIDLGGPAFPAPIRRVKDGNPEPPAAEANLEGLGPTVYKSHQLKGSLKGHLVATMSSAGAYKRVNESRTSIIWAGILAVIIIFVLAYVLARGMLRPILLLSEGAQRVSAGDLDVHLPVRGRDELADLTSAFNDMARRVRESRDELAQAASALARSNDQLEQAKERFRTQAITDALTGLFNRRHFEDTLDEQIERASAEGWSLSLLLLDLDHFKQYNDRWGHTEGDSELRRVAALVQRTVRSTDIAFRYGGEELAVLLPSCAKDQAVGVAEKVRLAVGSGTQRPSRFGARTTVSVGVATFPEDGRVARGLVDTADAALYQAKALGRDRVVAAGGPPNDGPAEDERATG